MIHSSFRMPRGGRTRGVLAILLAATLIPAAVSTTASASPDGPGGGTPETSRTKAFTSQASAQRARPAATVAETTLRFADFESLPTGRVTPSGFNSVLGGTNGNSYYYDDMSVVATGTSRGKVLRTKLDAGTIINKPSGNNGAVFFIPIPAVDRACVSYDIRFNSGFQWSLGGKLPGLQGVKPGYPASAPTGGHPTSVGWSGRLMWLGPKAYSWAGPSNMAVSYMYHPGQSSQYGDNVRWNTPFYAGTWHHVKTCYRLNTVGKADGALTAWMDGRQVINNWSYVYRTDSAVKITHLNFSIFRGGGTLDWAGSTTGYVDVDNMHVSAL